jgi:hypothetical protein
MSIVLGVLGVVVLLLIVGLVIYETSQERRFQAAEREWLRTGGLPPKRD